MQTYTFRFDLVYLNCIHRKIMGCGASRPDEGELDQPEMEQSTILHSLQPETLPRFAACSVLTQSGLPACIWLEDALEQLGVPTLVFDLFLLVHDADAAAQILTKSGYQRSEPSLAIRDIRQFNNVFTPARRETQDSTPAIRSLDGHHTSVILLTASDWFYHLPSKPEDMTDWFPTLPNLLSSLVAKWLSLDETELSLRLRIAVFLGYIYEYIGAVKSLGFEQQLPREYRVFHSDQLRGINAADLGTFRCQQHYLRKARSTVMEEGNTTIS